MAEYTPGINLYKPNVNDEVDVHQSLSENFTKIDESLADIAINVKSFGAKGDGITDDYLAIKDAIEYCRINKKSLYFPEGNYYTSQTLDVSGVKLKGQTQGVAELLIYKSKRLGDIGYFFMGNFGVGKTVTYSEMVDEALSGTVITSNVANPILKFTTDKGRFDLEDIAVVGWLRNTNQIGLGYEVVGTPSYISGGHKFKNVTVSGCGSHGIKIPSLEVSQIHNLRCNQNNGNGLRLEEIPDIDCPFEYVTFHGGDFNHNRLDGVWANNYRKMVKFKDVWLQNPGQYDLQGYTDDGVSRAYPATTKDLYAGVRIAGVAQYHSANRTGQMLVFDGCFGELCEKLVHIENKQGSSVLRDIQIKNCQQTKKGGSGVSALFYMDASYIYNFEVDHNNINNDVFGVFGTISEALGFKGQGEFVAVIPSTVKTAFNVEVDNVTAKQGFTVLLPSTTVDTTVKTLIPKNTLGSYYPGNNTSYKYVFFMISYNGQATNSLGETIELFCITRNNRGEYILKKITNNIATLAINATTGEISFTCPAWNSAGIQRVDNYFYKNV